eukprot:TRINITY_DN43256_c0_g1_i1.p1 TRINITY_DN43256_c0_g1~~TRINITY_DN43256_c0_g1_i1.p1  ORF type:complete len:604 (+),score=161.71 TRINITY_DN43256_c0_g1_i1:60-1814(+)
MGKSVYRYKWQWFDILAAMPFELLAVPMGYRYNDARFRVARLLNLMRLEHHFSCLCGVLYSGLFPTYVYVFRFLVEICCLIHLVSCLWIHTTGKREEESLSKKDPVLQYTTGFEWSVKVLSGYGSKPWPTTDLTHCLYLCVSIVGVAVLAVILALTQGFLQSLDPNKGVYEDTLDNVLTWLDQKNAPAEVREDFIKYYRYLWRITRCISTTQFNFLVVDEPGALYPLPTILADRLQFHLNGLILEQVPLFSPLIHNVEFVSEVIAALKLEVGVPGSCIVEQDDKSEAVYFIVQGRVDVLLNYKVHIKSLGPGDLFGEMGLIFGKPRFCTVRCQSHVQLYRMDRHSFVTIARRFPACFQELLDIAHERREELDLCYGGLEVLQSNMLSDSLTMADEESVFGKSGTDWLQFSTSLDKDKPRDPSPTGRREIKEAREAGEVKEDADEADNDSTYGKDEGDTDDHEELRSRRSGMRKTGSGKSGKSSDDATLNRQLSQASIMLSRTTSCTKSRRGTVFSTVSKASTAPSYLDHGNPLEASTSTRNRVSAILGGSASARARNPKASLPPIQTTGKLLSPTYEHVRSPRA